MWSQYSLWDGCPILRRRRRVGEGQDARSITLVYQSPSRLAHILDHSFVQHRESEESALLEMEDNHDEPIRV